MSKTAPPFAALRVLEAACRLRNYSAAGDELGVTHSAVSQTIRRLETIYGQRLFRRQGMQMAPATAAVCLAEAYREAARIVGRAGEALTGVVEDANLVIATVPSMAKLWFSPRLNRLRDALPDLTVEIRTSRDFSTLDGDGVDVAVRFGNGNWPHLHVEPLFDEFCFPVCSPDLQARMGPFTNESIAAAPLILEDSMHWPLWFAAAHVSPPQPLRGLVFDDAAVVIEAAAAGLGVALVRRIHAEAALESGRLVRISDVSVKSPLSCYLVWREESARIAHIRRFADWLFSECHRSGLLQAA
ncbi:MAG: LysR substrate-binding domain-containing protein [Caulobacterales bacterium]